LWYSANPDGVRSRVGDYHRMLSTHLNTLAAAGFVLEQVREPRPSAWQAELVPGNREVPTLLLIRAHAAPGDCAQAKKHVARHSGHLGRSGARAGGALHGGVGGRAPHPRAARLL